MSPAPRARPAASSSRRSRRRPGRRRRGGRRARALGRARGAGARRRDRLREAGARAHARHPRAGARRRGARSAVTSTSDLSRGRRRRAWRARPSRWRARPPRIPRRGSPRSCAGEPPRPRALRPGGRGCARGAHRASARAPRPPPARVDPRIVNSEGTQVGSDFSEIVYGNSRGFLGGYESAMPLAELGADRERERLAAARLLAHRPHRLRDLEDPAAVGRRAAERALRRLGARRVATCEVPGDLRSASRRRACCSSSPAA